MPALPEVPRMRRWLEYPSDTSDDSASDDEHRFAFDSHLERTVQLGKNVVSKQFVFYALQQPFSGLGDVFYSF